MLASGGVRPSDSAVVSEPPPSRPPPSSVVIASPTVPGDPGAGGLLFPAFPSGHPSRPAACPTASTAAPDAALVTVTGAISPAGWSVHPAPPRPMTGRMTVCGGKTRSTLLSPPGKVLVHSSTAR
ncbi:hypothetical protein CALCODRAFT_495195, partial [Calocera cornea HHB12733]